MKDPHGVGFEKSIEKVDNTVALEMTLLPENAREHLKEHLNFIMNLASLCYADGYEQRDNEVTKALKEIL